MRLTIRRVFVILLFLGLFLMTLRPIADPDFWWHLKTGEIIVETHAIPHSDPYSFTYEGKPWIAHEWLSELIFYALYRLGGFSLLIATFSFLITGTFMLAYLRSPKESRPYVAGFTLLLGTIASAPTWGVRPQMITLCISSLFLYLLDRYKEDGARKFILPLPLIMLVWVNFHAGYILGLAILAIYICGDLIELIKAFVKKKESLFSQTLQSFLSLCAVLMVSILATLANPNGFQILLYPFQTLNSQGMQQYIQEWFSPDFHQLEWQPLAWLFLTLIGAGMLGKKPITPVKILLTLFFGYSALRSMRHVPLFAIVAIPILSEQLASLVKIRPQVNKTFFLKWIAPVLLFLVVAVIGLRFAQVVQGQPKSEAETFPKSAVEWIETNHPSGNLFNSYGWGGYLIWHLYPQMQVYIDGRADVYGDKFILSYMDIYHARPGWDSVLAAADVRLVLVEPGSALASALEQSSEWAIAFEDQISTLFTIK
jgi:hypothetical protein